MILPQQNFVNVSGIDPNNGARIVFVWCRNKGPADYMLLGSGHVVDVPSHARPPGIQAGQYSVTFLLPPECSVDEVFVTDDKSGSDRLTGVTLRVGREHLKPPHKEEVSAADDSFAPARLSAASGRAVGSNGRS